MLTHRSATVLRAIASLAIGLSACASAQLYESPDPLRGSGQVQTCDTSMHVWFNTTYLSSYGCAFAADVDAGSTVVQDMTWYYYYDSNWVGTSSISPLYSAGGQPYPVCLNVNAYDLEAAQPCSTTVCQLITPLPEPICTTLHADFTIGSIDGNTITFQGLSTFDGTVGAWYWSFGDGGATTVATNVNTFSGAGPYEVCLTVVGAPPSECVSTVCKWLYLGPGDVECPVLVEQAYQMLTYENLVGVWDTSRTSGMYSRIDWEFGDGAEATGIIAVHAYAEAGEFQLCGTLRVWGPLLADTCASTICHPIHIAALTGIDDLDLEPGTWAYPSPCTGTLNILRDNAGTAEFRILDRLGRVVQSRSLPSGNGAIAVDLSALPPGIYIAQLLDAGGLRATRIVKQ